MSAVVNDRELLQEYVRNRSDAVFRELVENHTAMVYSFARQQLGDAHAAEDVTQSVFLALAIKAPKLPPATILAGWLYRATRFAAADYRRREQHRREREMQAHKQQQMNVTPDDSTAVWQEIEPYLHSALAGLPTADRDAVLLRFYRQSSYRDMAQTLAISEEAVKKRVGRAVERLRRFFGRRGIGLTAGVLASALGSHAAEAAPAGLTAQTTQVALSGAAGSMVSGSTLVLAKGVLKAMFIAKVKTFSLAAVTCLVVAGTGVVAAKQLAGSSTPAPSNTKVAASVATPVPAAAEPLPLARRREAIVHSTRQVSEW
jgi:RNA polymerase sigma factor (sigma-70 family)